MYRKQNRFNAWLHKKFGRSNRRNFDDLATGNPWHSMPLLRLCIPLIAGILVGNYVRGWNQEALLVLAGSTGWLLASVWLVRRIGYRYGVLSGALVLLMPASGGYLLMQEAVNTEDSTHFSCKQQPLCYALATLDESSSKRKSTYRAIASVQTLLINRQRIPCTGRLLLYIQADEAAAHIRYGQQLLFRLDAQPIKPPLNPFEFDFRQYMQRKGIYQQQYLRAGQWRVTQQEGGVWWKKVAYLLKEKITTAYRRYIPSRSQAGVASALIFGYRDDLDPDLVQAYAHTGTLHVLAVSGLHVGIIYVVLKWLFGRLMRRKSTRLLRGCIILVSLWFYAMLTGFSPSVNRAAFMFSFIVVAEALKRKPSIYNSIGGSAFVLLLADPLLVYDVGFQLSFAAVLGIIFLHTRIFDLWQPRTLLMNQVWNITCVSFAAQAATCAMGFYYFHQFPNYFLLSNLFIIPASTCITYLGLVLLVALPFPPLATGIGYLLDWLIQATNFMVYQIDAMPFSTFNGLTVSLPSAFAIAGIVICMLLFLFYQKKKGLWLAAACALFLATDKCLERMHYMPQREAWVYAMPGHTAIGVLTGGAGVIYTDTALLAYPRPLHIRTEQHGWYAHIGSFALLQLPSNTFAGSGNLLMLGNKKILQVCSNPETALPFGVDMLLLSGSPRVSIPGLKKLYPNTAIVADQSNSRYRLDQWRREARQLGLKVHFVDEQGAYRLPV